MFYSMFNTLVIKITKTSANARGQGRRECSARETGYSTNHTNAHARAAALRRCTAGPPALQETPTDQIWTPLHTQSLTAIKVLPATHAELRHGLAHKAQLCPTRIRREWPSEVRILYAFLTREPAEPPTARRGPLVVSGLLRLHAGLPSCVVSTAPSSSSLRNGHASAGS